MSTPRFPDRVPQARNLAIFWGATLEGKSQGELATEHGISQQRVSQIVRSVRLFLALATSEQFEGVPQGAQLQLGCRIQLEKLSRRRRGVAQAWDASTKPFTSVKRVQSSQGERVETVEKSRYGDWRLDRQLGEIDKQILDTTVLLYERPWVGREELRIGRKGTRNAELGMRNWGEVDAVVEVEPASAPSAIRNPQPAIAPARPHSAFPVPNSEFRAEPICDLTGEWIKPPSDAHRPWRRVLLPREWLFPAGTLEANTPEGVLWDSQDQIAQVARGEPRQHDASALARVPWDEIERRAKARLARAGLAAAP